MSDNNYEQGRMHNDESDHGETDHASHVHKIPVILNGTRIEVDQGKYTYEQIYDLAFPGQPIASGFEMPITYKMPHSHFSGALLPGESLELRKGLVINVRPTIKS